MALRPGQGHPLELLDLGLEDLQGPGADLEDSRPVSGEALRPGWHRGREAAAGPGRRPGAWRRGERRPGWACASGKCIAGEVIRRSPVRRVSRSASSWPSWGVREEVRRRPGTAPTSGSKERPSSDFTRRLSSPSSRRTYRLPGGSGSSGTRVNRDVVADLGVGARRNHGVARVEEDQAGAAGGEGKPDLEGGAGVDQGHRGAVDRERASRRDAEARLDGGDGQDRGRERNGRLGTELERKAASLLARPGALEVAAAGGVGELARCRR